MWFSGVENHCFRVLQRNRVGKLVLLSYPCFLHACLHFDYKHFLGYQQKSGEITEKLQKSCNTLCIFYHTPPGVKNKCIFYSLSDNRFLRWFSLSLPKFCTVCRLLHFACFALIYVDGLF